MKFQGQETGLPSDIIILVVIETCKLLLKDSLSQTYNSQCFFAVLINAALAKNSLQRFFVTDLVNLFFAVLINAVLIKSSLYFTPPPQ